LSQIRHPDITPRFRALATACALLSLVVYAAILCITPASINEIQRTFRASGAQMGRVYWLISLSYFVTVLAGGRLSHRTGKLPIVAAGCLLMAVGAWLFVPAATLPMVFAAAVVMGAGGGLSEGSAMALISDLYGGVRRTAMMNWSQVVFTAGAVGMPLAVAHVISSQWGWRAGYAGAAAACAAAGIVSLFAAATRHEQPHAIHEAQADWGDVLSDRLVIGLSLGIGLYVGAEIGQMAWLAAFFEKDLHSSGPLAARSVALFWVGIGAGRAAGALASHRISDIGLILASTCIGIAAETALLLSRTPEAGLAATVVLGFGLGPVWPTILSFAGAARPRQSGTVMGVVVASGSVGAAVFPPLIGWFSDMTGLRPALGICLALHLANLLLFLWLQCRTRPAPHEVVPEAALP